MSARKATTLPTSRTALHRPRKADAIAEEIHALRGLCASLSLYLYGYSRPDYDGGPVASGLRGRAEALLRRSPDDSADDIALGILTLAGQMRRANQTGIAYALEATLRGTTYYAPLESGPQGAD